MAKQVSHTVSRPLQRASAVPSVADVNSLCALRTVLYWQGKQQHWAVESIEEQRKTTTGGSTVLVRWIGYAAATWEPLCELEHTDAYELFLRESSATSAMIMREDELPDDPFADCADTPLFVPFVPIVFVPMTVVPPNAVIPSAVLMSNLLCKNASDPRPGEPDANLCSECIFDSSNNQEINP